MENLTLIYGAGKIERIVSDVDKYLLQYREDTGHLYQNYSPSSPIDKVIPEDLAVTLLMNSQVGWRAFQTLVEFGDTINLLKLPKKSLEKTSHTERQQVAVLISEMAQLPGFGSSVATKVLHKKRPNLIPVLDNQAIYGAYMNPNWPEKPARQDTIKDYSKILEALEWITYDLNRPENTEAWNYLQTMEPTHSRIQLFDSIWWIYFRREKQPLRKKNV